MDLSKLFFLSLIFILNACSMDASIVRGSVASILEPTIQKLPAKSTGLVSGSNQSGTAVGGGSTYVIQSSVGAYASGIEQRTTDDEYKVYSSVQGAIISNE